MQKCQHALIFILSFTVVAYGQGNSFEKIRYNGGSVQTKVKPDDWGNRLTVTPEEIKLDLKDGQAVTIDPGRVTALSYGQEAHRRVGTMVALGILVAPLALFGLFHKTRLHYVGIEFKTAEERKSGLLLQAHKNNYRAVLMALKGVTGAPISVSEEDRKYVPADIGATSSKEADKAGSAGTTMDEKAASQAEMIGTVHISSEPGGAEIWIDGEYMGNAPAHLRLPARKHSIRLTSEGFEDWVREIKVVADSDLNVKGVLKKRK